MSFFLIALLFFLNLSSVQADDSYKLLIPNELDFENPEQKKNEIYNFSRSGLSHFEWRKRKCYIDVVFNIFWKSKLCPGDPSICIHSYTVEELHTFYNYYNYLLDISELCAESYQLDNDDRSIFTNSSQTQEIEFASVHMLLHVFCKLNCSQTQGKLKKLNLVLYMLSCFLLSVEQ